MGKDAFLEYYKRNLCLDDDDFMKFYEGLNDSLPSVFRVLNTSLKKFIIKKLDKWPFIRKITYFENVYEFSLSFKEKTDSYKEFVQFLVNQTNIGSIQRQEIVSMLPVLLMGLEPHHTILDMCASPGSKTKQILEIIDDRGLVIANDRFSKRINILQTETFKVPNSSLVITQGDASNFPNVCETIGRKFDRVLCDVPCSSDGTFKKASDLLDKWSIKNGLGQYDVQWKLLKRACEMVSEDGLVVYSTCSLNPVENECVVQKIVMEMGMEIVDLRNEYFNLGTFKTRKGLTKWKIDEILYDELLKPVAFDIGLEKCIRVLPHDQNTGGFFIVGLRKPQKGYKAQRIESHSDSAASTENILSELEINSKYFEKISSEEVKAICFENKLNINASFIKRKKTNTSINILSPLATRILNNPKLKIINAGYKIFEKCSLNESNYRLKNSLFNDVNIIIDYEIRAVEFYSSLIKKRLDRKYKNGFVTLKINDLDIILTGFSNGNKVDLYISDNLMKALLDFKFFFVADETNGQIN